MISSSQGFSDIIVMNRDTCVTCHTRHTSVTDFRPKSGNPVEVTLVTSPKLYIVPTLRELTSLSFNIDYDTPLLSFIVWGRPGDWGSLHAEPKSAAWEPYLD